MIETIKYYCEYCGKEFDNDCDCLAHENEEKLKTVKNDLHMDGEKIPLNNHFSIDEVAFVIAETAEARKVFEDFQYRYGLVPCYKFLDADCDTLMYYDYQKDKWYSWQEKVNDLYEC